MSDLRVEAVKQYASDHYNDGGWDVVVECWTDGEILEAIQDCTTPAEALAYFTDLASVWADRQADAINSAF